MEIRVTRHTKADREDKKKYCHKQRYFYNLSRWVMPQYFSDRKLSWWLPPTSEGWVRYCFHRCVSVYTQKGYPSPRFFPRSLVPGPSQGGTLVPGSFPGHWSQVLSGGTPALAGGYLSPSQGMGYPSVQKEVRLFLKNSLPGERRMFYILSSSNLNLK